MQDDLCFLTIAKAADLIASRRLSPVELTEALLRRIGDIDPQLHAYLTLTSETARSEARVAEAEIARGGHRGPLHGIPFAVKDVIETAGVLTTACSKVLQHHVPKKDAAAVARMRAAGAVMLGKVVTHEFAHGGPSFDLPWPPARNPWNTMHFSGGSSSGSAAAVAAGLATCALGTDTGGSVRSPSWLCGIAGMKPTFGLVSRAGLVPFSSSCDHVGPMAWTVEDCALMLEALAGHDPADRGSTTRKLPPLRPQLTGDIRGLRIGVVRHFWEKDITVGADLRAAVDAAIDVLKSLGAHVEEVSLRPLDQYYAVRLMLTESELFALHEFHLREHAADYGHHFLSRCLPACLYTNADYIAAQRQRSAILQEMEAVYAKYDALVTAGAGPAPSLMGHKTLGSADKFLRPGMGTLFSVTGAPALALCCGFDAAGLPLGLQIAGRPYEDGTVLRIGDAYERATGWRARRPQLEPGATSPFIDAAGGHTSPVAADPKLRALVETMVRRSSLVLSPEHMDLLLETAPYALELVKRIRRDLDWSYGQAAVFTMPPGAGA
jgi:aspartyl-tRNA(Asn)/glutamyl-tRNA(Gln) amidotransferase subunit A